MADEYYDGFVVVAETEWKFDYGDFEASRPKISGCYACDRQDAKCSCGYPIQFTANPRITKHSLKMGTIDWNITFNDSTKKLEFSCENLVVESTVSEVHAELIPYGRSAPNGSYGKKKTIRQLFTRSANSLVLYGNYFTRDNLVTIRVLKSRSMLNSQPDFTLESTVFGGRWASDVKLRVAGQIFHVNKQLLSMHSNVFDRMFNDKFKEANQDVVELKHERADPVVFHDFLLVMHVPEALPNPENVAALSYLANIYQVDNVLDKCHRHLWMCREMPVEERFMLAGELGLNELKTSVKRNASFEERERIIDAVSKKAFALTK